MTDTNTKNFDFSEYKRLNHDESNTDDHGELSVEMATELAKRIYPSNWYLSPTFEGCFNSREETLAFIEQIPEAPLCLVIPTNSCSGAVVTKITTLGDRVQIEDWDDYHNERADYASIDELLSKAADFAQHLTVGMSDSDLEDGVKVEPYNATV